MRSKVSFWYIYIYIYIYIFIYIHVNHALLSCPGDYKMRSLSRGSLSASAVISPLRQWLDSYAKTRLKMWHTFKHFIHMQYFLLPTNLFIVFVHWISTVVYCTNPDNVHCFGTIFPNLNFVFASICAARPVHIQSDQYRSCSTVNKVNNVTTRDRCSRHSSRWGATKNSTVALISRNNMISIHQRSTRTNEGKTTLI